MPIEVGADLRTMTKQDFYELDYRVMGISFKIQNAMGRFWKENIYQNELVYQCKKAAFASVCYEVPVVLRFGDFCTHYYIDVLINGAAVYELKTVTALAPAHVNQTLTYLFLINSHHAKLLNFAAPRLESRFVSTTRSLKDRFRFQTVSRKWVPEALGLKELVIQLVNEWGCFLDVNLYRKAVIHCLGGEEKCMIPVAVHRTGRSLGVQKMCLINNETAIKLTSLYKNLDHYEKHLNRVLEYTCLTKIQWINLMGNQIIFKTITQQT